MGTITAPTRQLVGLLSDLILTSGIDPELPTTRGILLHTTTGEFVPDLPGADDGQEPLIDAVETKLLVGTSTDTAVVGQAHIPVEFDGPIGWPDPVFVDLLDAQAVAREFKTKVSMLGREVTHRSELTVSAGTLTVREDPSQVPGGLRMAFQVDDGSLFPKVHERMQPDPTELIPGPDGFTVVEPSYGTGYNPAHVEVFAKVGKRRQMPVAVYRYHQNRTVVVEIGASYRAAVGPYTLDEDHGQHLAPTVRVFAPPVREKSRLEAVSDE